MTCFMTQMQILNRRQVFVNSNKFRRIVHVTSRLRIYIASSFIKAAITIERFKDILSAIISRLVRFSDMDVN